MARQLAGHANAAAGQRITWIVGVDEDAAEVVGSPSEELANWWPQVCKQFDAEIVPDPTSVHVPVGDDRSVLAIAFETDRAPYVVKTGATGGAEREVPWRELNRTRTAYRRELLTLLLGIVTIPDAEIIEVDIEAYKRQDALEFYLSGTMFLTAPGPHATLLPHHQATATIQCDPAGMSGVSIGELPVDDLSWNLPHVQIGSKPWETAPISPNAQGVDATQGVTYVMGGGAVEFSGTAPVLPTVEGALGDGRDLRVRVTMSVAGTAKRVTAEAVLSPSSTAAASAGSFAAWHGPAPPQDGEESLSTE